LTKCYDSPDIANCLTELLLRSCHIRLLHNWR